MPARYFFKDKRFSTTVLSASASRLQIDGGPANAQGRFELKLWGPAISRIAFEQAQPVASVLFLSERDLGDLASILNGGIIRNRWDLPLRATGSPFEFEGTLAAMAVLARPAGLRMVCAASRDAGFSPEGLVLENLFLTVRPPSRLMLQGSYDGVSAVADGAAFLWFDVVLAQPMFPDPYATNWSVPTADTARPAALSTHSPGRTLQRRPSSRGSNKPSCFLSRPTCASMITALCEMPSTTISSPGMNR